MTPVNPGWCLTRLSLMQTVTYRFGVHDHVRSCAGRSDLIIEKSDRVSLAG